MKISILIYRMIKVIIGQKFRQVSENTCAIYSLKLIVYIYDIEDNVIGYFVQNKHKFDEVIYASQIVDFLEEEKICYDAYSINSDDFIKEFSKISIVEGIIENHYVTVLYCALGRICYFDSQSGIVHLIKVEKDKVYNVIEIDNNKMGNKQSSKQKSIKKKSYLISFILSAIITLLSVLFSFILWFGIDVIEQNNFVSLQKLSLIFIILVAVKTGLEFLNQSYLEYLVNINSNELEEKLTKIDKSKLFNSFKQTTVLHRYERIREIIEMNVLIKMNTFFNVIATLILLFVTHYVNGILFRYVILGIIIISTLTILYSKSYSKQQKQYHFNTQAVKEKIQKKNIVKFDENKAQLIIFNNIKKLQIEYDTYSRGTITLLNLIVIISGLYMIYLNEIPTGNLVTFISLINMIFMNVDNISKIAIDYIEYGYSRNMIVELLEAKL